jgi:hypothetical protein
LDFFDYEVHGLVEGGSGFGFGDESFSEGCFPELGQSFLGERLGIEFPREVKVVEVAFEFSSFFGPFGLVGRVIGLVIEREHVGHVLVVMPQFMK